MLFPELIVFMLRGMQQIDIMENSMEFYSGGITEIHLSDQDFKMSTFWFASFCLPICSILRS